MKRSIGTRRLGLSLVLALVLAALVVPATPAAATHEGNEYWSLQTNNANVRRDGVDYKFSIDASEFYGLEIISLDITKRQNPDGPVDLTQTHRWNMDTDATNNRFRHPETNLSEASLVTGNEWGEYGGLNLKFTADKPLEQTCNGNIRSRGGVLSGTVSFKTNTGKFGTIGVRPSRATLYFQNGHCETGGGGGGGGNPCPPRSRSISGGRSTKQMSLFASRNDGASRYYLSGSHFEMLNNEEGSVSHMISGWMPGSNFGVADQVGSGRIEGESGTWVTGQATYDGGAATSEGWSNCGGDKEAKSLSSSGELTGGLKLNFFLGPDRAVNDAPFDYAFGGRTIVRLR